MIIVVYLYSTKVVTIVITTLLTMHRENNINIISLQDFRLIFPLCLDIRDTRNLNICHFRAKILLKIYISYTLNSSSFKIHQALRLSIFQKSVASSLLQSEFPDSEFKNVLGSLKKC